MTGSIADGRTGLVLAAGYGARHALGNDLILKPLLPVGGRALILRTLDSLELAGCSRVVVVVGYAEDRIRQFLQESHYGELELVLVSNERFDLNNGVSILAARNVLPEEFVLAMADHVFEPAVMQLVARHMCPPQGARLVVDFKLDAVFDIEDATKVIVENGRVVRIGKELSEFNAVDCGLFLAGHSLIDALDEVFQATGNVSLSQGVQRLAQQGRMHALDIGPGRWQDVDTTEMLSAAERLLNSGHAASKPSEP